jgi:hypothetical protein
VGVEEGRRRKELVPLGDILIGLYDKLSWIPNINNGESTQAIAGCLVAPPSYTKRLRSSRRTAGGIPGTRSSSWRLFCGRAGGGSGGGGGGGGGGGATLSSRLSSSLG